MTLRPRFLRMVFSVAAGLLVAGLLVAAATAADAGEAIYEEGFDSPDSLEDWRFPDPPQWSVADGRLLATNTSPKPAVGCRGPRFDGQPAMRLSLRVQPLDAKQVDIKLNHPTGGHVWRVILSPRGFEVRINTNRHIPIKTAYTLAPVAKRLDGQAWHDVRIDLDGDAVTVRVDETEQTFRDKHFAHPLGSVGLSIRGQEARFDDLRIEPLEATDPPAATPPVAISSAEPVQSPAMSRPAKNVASDANVAATGDRSADEPPPVFDWQHVTPFAFAASHDDAALSGPQVRTLLAASCGDCHMDGAAEGNFALDLLPDDLTDAETRRRWTLMLDRIAAGEMPPQDADPLVDQDRVALLAAAGASLHAADAASREVVLRRLGRVEYENTVRDLFGVDVAVADRFPVDAVRGGFDNNGAALALSAELIETYLEVADAVIDAALGPVAPPKSVALDTEVRELVNHTMYDKWYKLLEIDGGTVVYSSNFGAGSQLNGFKAPSDGTYRIRLDVSAYQSDEPVLMQVQLGQLTRSGSKRLAGFYEAPPSGRTIEIVAPLSQGDSVYPRPYGTTNNISAFLQKDYRREKLLQFDGAGLKIDRVRIDGPLDAWPPPSRSRLLGDVDPATATAPDAAAIFARLLPRAFRRPVPPEQTQRYAGRVAELMADGRSFDEALRWTLRAMLCSAEFLFLEEPATVESENAIDDFALAGRLSYFLWSSMPDEELRAVAGSGRLSEPAVLAEQTARMLRDPKAEALVTNFAAQWLDLREIDATSPDTKLYPDFDEFLQHSMVGETHAFVRAVLRENRSVREFIDSDWAMLNRRMARHYGLAGPPYDALGVGFERVPLPPGSVRGGLMTQASVLKITANGANTSPVTRGVWMLENLMGIHPPPPPPNVPAVVPDVSGAQTLRQLLAAHRSDGSCNSCHRKIDPPGFALEEFDAIGAWRDSYRFQGSRRLLPVDSSGQTPQGEQFADVRQYKRLLMTQIDQVAAGLADKLLTYATGRTVGFSDRPVVDAIVDQVADRDYRFADLIHAVVQSPSFRRP